MAGTVNPQLPLPTPSAPDAHSILRTFTQWANSLVNALFTFGQRINICLPKDGTEAMTGALTTKGITDTATVTLAADPTSALEAATKQYVDAAKTAAESYTDTQIATLANPNLHVGLTTTQSVSSGVFTKCLFDTVARDTQSWWDATNHRYTPQKAGMYLVGVGLYATGTSISVNDSVIYVNGVEMYRASQEGGAGVGTLVVTGLVPMNGSTDYIEGWGRVSATSPQFLGGTTLSFMWVIRIGP